MGSNVILSSNNITLVSFIDPIAQRQQHQSINCIMKTDTPLQTMLHQLQYRSDLSLPYQLFKVTLFAAEQ
jgi:hypothetical protein